MFRLLHPEETVLFSQMSSLPFTGLHKIQKLLDLSYFSRLPPEVLLVTASLPSLSEAQKSELDQLIAKHDKIVFWCYGDLLWNFDYWQSRQQILIGKNVKWVVASKRWQQVAESFISRENLELIPHPFSHPQKMDRDWSRSQLNLRPDDRLLLFAGRRSQQKNIPWLLRLWNEHRSQTSPHLKLALVGSWCEYGIPQEPSLSRPMQSIRRRFEETRKLFPDEILDFGELQGQSLHTVMNAADLAVSCSTFLEEDFGLFLREALTLGTPVLATDWGGHADLTGPGIGLVPLINEELDFSLASKLLPELLSCKLPGHFEESILPDFENWRRFDGFTSRQKIPTNDLKKILSGLEH